MPAMMIYNFGAAILRAFGDTKRPLYYISTAGFLNVVLNVLFTGVLKMDVAGVSLATAISQTVSATLIIRYFTKSDRIYKLNIKELKIHKDKAKEIIRIGVPSGLYSMVFSISNIIIQSEVNLFGPAVISGNSVGTSVETFMHIFLNSIHQAAVTFTSQNLGAKQYDRIKKIAKTSLITVVVMGLIIGEFVSHFSRELAGFYASDPEVIQYAMVRMRTIVPLYFLYGAMDTLTGVLRGMGKSVASMLISATCVLSSRFIYIFTYYQRFKTYETLYYCFPLSWIVAFSVEVIAFIYFYKKLVQSGN